MGRVGGGTTGEDEKCIQRCGGETLMEEPPGRPRRIGRNIVPDNTDHVGTGWGWSGLIWLRIGTGGGIL